MLEANCQGAQEPRTWARQEGEAGAGDSRWVPETEIGIKTSALLGERPVDSWSLSFPYP